MSKLYCQCCAITPVELRAPWRIKRTTSGQEMHRCVGPNRRLLRRAFSVCILALLRTDALWV